MKLKVAKRWIQLGLLCLGTVVSLVIVAWAYERHASQQVLLAYPPPGEFLDISGHKMHYMCQGTEAPTLVLLHGYAGGALDWLPLMDVLPSQQRVCAFDRFGSDYSDSLTSQSVTEVLEHLHSALEQLRIEAPIVVGHSLGGAVAQLYAASYPVQGVVLVDGLSADVADDVAKRLGSYSALRPLAQVGLLRPLASSFIYDGYSTALKEQMLALRSRAANIVAIADEGQMARATISSEVLRESETQMTVPILIIASGQADVPEGDAFRAALEALHSRQAYSSYHEIPEASHYLIVSHAQQISDYLSAWLNQAYPQQL